MGPHVAPRPPVEGGAPDFGQLLDERRADAVALFPAARAARLERLFVTCEPAATFRQAPGSQRLRPRTCTQVPGLYLAGAWTDTGWPATMEGAVRSGLAAAHAALVGAGRTLGLPQVAA